LKNFLKTDEISLKFHEIMKFFKNNFPFEYIPKGFNNNNADEDARSMQETPKKGISRTIYKKPTVISQFKFNEKKPRKSTLADTSN